MSIELAAKSAEQLAEQVPAQLRIVCDEGSRINLLAADSLNDGKPALRKFSMTAYTGGAMQLAGWQHPVVVDLAGLKVARKSRPILKDHNRSSIVGHTSLHSHRRFVVGSGRRNLRSR